MTSRATIDEFLMVRAGAAGLADGQGGRFGLGSKRSWVPIIGEIVWEIPKRDEARGYYAYICNVADRQIGYIRVPDYHYDEAAVGIFDDLVTRFDGATAALVIDQVENPGGSMHQMYALLSRLTDKPLTLPRHQVTICDDAAAVAADVVANAADEPPERVAYSRLLLSEQEAGRGTSQRLSHPLYLYGVEQVLPAAHRYTGDIVVLINERTFSAGEFLAAILQDNQQATLFGRRTAGAGGCVRKATVPGSEQFGIEAIEITWTIARRTNGDLIENLGVQPDIRYEPTVEDFQSSDPFRSDVNGHVLVGFQGYRRALLAALDEVASGSARGGAPFPTPIHRP